METMSPEPAHPLHAGHSDSGRTGAQPQGLIDRPIGRSVLRSILRLTPNNGPRLQEVETGTVCHAVSCVWVRRGWPEGASCAVKSGRPCEPVASVDTGDAKCHFAPNLTLGCGTIPLMETSYLLRSPKNAPRLLSALESAREGHVVERGLMEP